MFNAYREEKLAFYNATGDEGGFLSFGDWKAERLAERDQNYVTVTVAQADKWAEDIQVEVDSPEATTAEDTTNTTEEKTMSETNAAEVTTEVTTTKPARKRVAAKSKSKMDLARSIVKRFSRGKQINRAKVLEVLQKEAGLTAKGASTYFQKLKTEVKGGATA